LVHLVGVVLVVSSSRIPDHVTHTV